MAYVASGKDADPNLWIQDLEKTEPRAIKGSEGATFLFWSPTSEFIGFVAGGELKKISPDGGPAITLCRLPSGSFRDGAWSPDGEWIVFAAGPPLMSLYQVSAQGGSPKLLFGPENSEPVQGFRDPHFLPLEAGERSRDGKELFYVEDDTLMTVSVTTGPRFSVGSPKPLFKDSNLRRNFVGHGYDVSRDGRRFVLAESIHSPRAIRVVQNWYAEFRDRQK